jgi:hypothetical protein
LIYTHTYISLKLLRSDKLDYLEFIAASLHGFGLLNDSTLAKVFDDLDSRGRFIIHY